MPASLEIPEQHRLGLAKLRELSDENINQIISVLQRMPLTAMKRKEIGSSLASVIPNLTAEDLEKIADTLFSLYYIRANAEVSVAKFASDVCRAFQDTVTEKFTEDKFAHFKDRITKLLGVDPLTVASKALVLQSDYENSFCDAKILTDVRPVFGARVEDQPAGFVITHTLKVEYHDDRVDHREFYVALDQDDLTTLRNVLERADKKAKSLQALMAKAGVPRLNTD